MQPFGKRAATTTRSSLANDAEHRCGRLSPNGSKRLRKKQLIVSRRLCSFSSEILQMYAKHKQRQQTQYSDGEEKERGGAADVQCSVGNMMEAERHRERESRRLVNVE